MKKIYTIILFALIFSQVYAHTDPSEGLIEVPLTGLTTSDGYTFHIYSADGKLNIGYTEIFIALTDNTNHFIDDFAVSDFLPLMDMGMSKHSTPVGNVAKITDKALYKTWFSFLMYTGQMGGSWSLSFNYTIGTGAAKNIANVAIPVDNYPANNKWLQSFTFNGSSYYLSVINPKNITTGSQTIKAYINKKENVLLPYLTVQGGFRIEATPFMRSMGHGSQGNTDLIWNASNTDYEGTLNFSMDGDWRVNLRVFDAVADTLIAGTVIDANGNGSTHYWDFYLESSTATKDIDSKGTSVYPTLTQGSITVVTPSKAVIIISDYTGRNIASYHSSGTETIQLDVPNGLYFVSVNSDDKTLVQKIIVKKQ